MQIEGGVRAGSESDVFDAGEDAVTGRREYDERVPGDRTGRHVIDAGGVGCGAQAATDMWSFDISSLAAQAPRNHGPTGPLDRKGPLLRGGDLRAPWGVRFDSAAVASGLGLGWVPHALARSRQNRPASKRPSVESVFVEKACRRWVRRGKVGSFRVLRGWGDATGWRLFAVSILGERFRRSATRTL